MAQAPRKAKRSAAQVKAGAAFARAGRAAQARTRAAAIAKTGKPPPRSRKQQAAAKAFAASGRAAQAARRAGKTPVTKKKPAAPVPDTWTAAPLIVEHAPYLGIHDLPACAPVALAAHLRFWTGAVVPAVDLLALHDQAGLLTLADLLEHVAAEGLAGPGTKLAHYERCDPGETVPGLVYGVQLDHGYHAVLAVPGGMTSWGTVLPLAGTPEEAWWLEWEDE